MRLSCVEIYHESVFDLFVDEFERQSLPVREHARNGFFVEGCSMVPCADRKAAMRALASALRNRQIGEHDLNSRLVQAHLL